MQYGTPAQLLWSFSWKLLVKEEKMRILLVSPSCAPFGSETIIGYQLARALAEYVEVVVVTHNFFRNAIEGAGGLGRAEPAYLELEAQAARSGKIAKRFKLSAAGITFVHYPLSIAFERRSCSISSLN